MLLDKQTHAYEREYIEQPELQRSELKRSDAHFYLLLVDHVALDEHGTAGARRV